MREPIDTLQVPPGGFWRYREPETGVVVESNHHAAFLAQAFQHREANGLYTGGGWQAEVWDLFCMQNPNFPSREIGTPERHLTIDDIRRFSVTVSRWIGAGGKWVAQEEAERRAAICVGCPNNKSLPGCWGCRGPLNWLKDMLGGNQTSHDSNLESCAKCFCNLRVKVHLPLDVIDNEGVTDLPDFCWMR